MTSRAFCFNGHAPQRRGIQYSAAFIGIVTLAFTGSPAFAGDDSGKF
jgi:hypothetical protein